MRTDLPSGTVTFLFTDVEGSTRLLHSLGEEAYAEALAEHRSLIREACAAEGGVEVDTQGDAFFFAFASAPAALSAASAFTDALAATPIRVRCGLHTGTPLLAEEGYVGHDVHLAARVASAGSGGQVVVSTATRAALDPGNSLVQALSALGSYRLKDVPEPLTLYQLGEGSFPQLKTIANSNLPSPASSFLGRADELYQADLLLQSTRLLTVSGPGGQGKTRFALELARRAREERFGDYEDGVYSAFFSSLRDPGLVLATIAQTLSVGEQPGRSALDTLTSHLHGKRMLLLLDNLEHLLEAAGELSGLLERAPGLTLLVTSREVLRIKGEESYSLPPLPDEEGIALFCERARVEPTPTIAELARRLEGLPLAIELAAARLSVLTPAQLLERLASRLDLLKGTRDADPRQQTLRATIEWSYDLLTPEEQALFRSLSVFAGGCTLEAAEEVCGADLDTLHSLVDKSLLRFTDERFWMLETLREYAAERLEESGEAASLLARHAEWFVALAREYSASAVAGRSSFDLLELELPNFRDALERAADAGSYVLVELASRLWGYWAARDHIVEGQRWIEAALEHPGVTADARDQLLGGALWMAYERGDYDAAWGYGEMRLALAESRKDGLAEARALTMLGAVSQERGDFREALSLSERAVAITRAREDAGAARWMALHNLGVVCERAGDSSRARQAFAAALAAAETAGDVGQVAMNHHSWAGAALVAAEIDEAREHLREGLALWVAHGVAQNFLDAALIMAAVVAKSDGRLRDAARLLAATERHDEETGRVLPPQHRLRFDAVRESLRDDLSRDDLLAEWAIGRSLTLGEAVDYALASLD